MTSPPPPSWILQHICAQSGVDRMQMISACADGLAADEATFASIAELARGLGVTGRTLRYYQDRGLVRSERVEQNVRVFSQRQAEAAAITVTLRAMGLPVDAIRKFLKLRDDPAAQEAALRALLIPMKIAHEDQLVRVNAMLKAIDKRRAGGVDESAASDEAPTAPTPA